MFCTEKCNVAWRKENPDAPLHRKLAPKYDKICANCGVQFKAKLNRAKCCSKNCNAILWQRSNPDKVKKIQSDHHAKNKKRVNASSVKWKMHAYKTNPSYRIRHLMNGRLNALIRRRQMNQKHGRTLALVGCSWPFLKAYLESMFRAGMNWNNLGSAWQIDHIKAVSTFNLFAPSEQIAAFHYSNLQPLFKEENHKKRHHDVPPEFYIRTGESVPLPFTKLLAKECWPCYP